MITDLMEGGAAVSAGLNTGDEITTINGEVLKGKPAEEIRPCSGHCKHTCKIGIKRHGSEVK